MAKVASAPILAFNVKIPTDIKNQADSQKIIIREYKVIYKLLEEIAAVSEGFTEAKEELKEEFRQSEGDPNVKSRIRALQLQMGRKRMMASVPKADVVITNPTHIAVAIEYKRENMGAPKVVAKGAGLIAEKIKEIARANGVVVVENKPLARTLFKVVDIGAEIPANFYKAVAEILAYVYRLKKTGTR